eukprot:IDg19413t1
MRILTQLDSKSIPLSSVNIDVSDSYEKEFISREDQKQVPSLHGSKVVELKGKVESSDEGEHQPGSLFDKFLTMILNVAGLVHVAGSNPSATTENLSTEFAGVHDTSGSCSDSHSHPEL